MSDRTLKTMCKLWLKQWEMDGLYNTDAVCACSIDDLMPCDEPSPDCEAGYKAPCDCGEGCDWHIQKDKYQQTHDTVCDLCGAVQDKPLCDGCKQGLEDQTVCPDCGSRDNDDSVFPEGRCAQCHLYYNMGKGD